MRILQKSATVLLCIAIGIVVLFGVAAFLGRDEPSGRGGWILGIKPMVVLGASMEPAIHVGSLLVVGRVDPASIEPGDIVSFAVAAPAPGSGATGPVTTHRVMSVATVAGSPVFRTQGDANSSADEGDVPASAVLGRALFAVPYVGYVRSLVSSRLGSLLLIAACAAIAVSETIALVRALRARTGEPRRQAHDCQAS